MADEALTGDLALSELTSDQSGSTYYSFQGSQLSVSVRAADCSVSRLFMLSSSGVGPKTIDESSAVATAEAFLADRGVVHEGMDRAVEWRDHGDTSEYEISWTRHEGGALVPNSIVIGVDASTGLVFRYSRYSHPYESPSAPPPIDRQTAESIAKARVGGAAPLTIEQSELRIGFTAGGEQRLIWDVVVSGQSGPDPIIRAYWRVEVDAETGLAEITAQG